MSDKAKHNINTFSLIFISAAISIIGYFVLTDRAYSRDQNTIRDGIMIEMLKEMGDIKGLNTADHAELKGQLKGIDIWTRQVYEAETVPNGELSKKNKEEIVILKTKVGLY